MNCYHLQVILTQLRMVYCYICGQALETDTKGYVSVTSKTSQTTVCFQKFSTFKVLDETVKWELYNPGEAQLWFCAVMDCPLSPDCYISHPLAGYCDPECTMDILKWVLLKPQTKLDHQNYKAWSYFEMKAKKNGLFNLQTQPRSVFIYCYKLLLFMTLQLTL